MYARYEPRFDSPASEGWVCDRVTGLPVRAESARDGSPTALLGFRVCGSRPLAVRILAEALDTGTVVLDRCHDDGECYLSRKALRGFFATVGSSCEEAPGA